MTGLTGEIRARTPPPEFFALLRGFIEDSSNSKLERQILIGGVGEAATKQTVEFFINLRQTATDPEVRGWALGGLAGIGRVGTESGAQLVAPLEKLWRDTSDPQVLMTIANPLAEIGAASSVQFLLDAALAPPGKDDARKAAAQNALRQIDHESATPPVAALLAQSAVGSPNAKLAGDILVHIGGAAAGTALVNWLQVADDRAAPQAREWVSNTKAPILSDIWQAATGAQFSFRSEKVREAIRTRLAERRAGIISEKVTPGDGGDRNPGPGPARGN